MMKLEIPTVQLVNEYLTKYDSNFSEVDKAIQLLIKTFPENVEFSHILLKVATINQLYRTNLHMEKDGVLKTAEQIQKLKIDSDLKRGLPTVVEKIAAGNGGNAKYSFATKYCSFHNPDAYPIFDDYVHKLLTEYGKQGILDLKGLNLKSYIVLVQVIRSLQDKYQLTTFTLKQIDKFLWYYARDNLK